MSMLLRGVHLLARFSTKSSHSTVNHSRKSSCSRFPTFFTYSAPRSSTLASCIFKTGDNRHLASSKRAFSQPPKAQAQESNHSQSSPPLQSKEERLLKLMPTHDANGQPYTLYEKCVRRLYLTNLFHPVKLGLENMKALHEELGNPMNNPNLTVIHVAGTNGKGSVTMKIAKTLQLAGHKVGLFVSPHVASFRERMQINEQLITEEEVAEYLPFIYDICEREHIPATFFEITTALAFHYFAKSGADVVVLETGLGGRLDATNVIQRPSLCVITSIGLEHTRILGDTIELIAAEKAGIIKPDCPVLVGPNAPHDVIRECARVKGAEGFYTCEDVLLKGQQQQLQGTDNDLEFVDYDIENSRVAAAALEIVQKKGPCTLLPISADHIKQGTSVRPPCRFEEFKIAPPNDDSPVTVILDVAHNPSAMELLVTKLERTYPNQEKRIVVGFSSDKDLESCGKSLLSIVSDPSRIHLVEAAHPRAASLQEILDAEPRLAKSNFDENDRSITNQVNTALQLACVNNEILVVCGSVFLMAEAREALGFDEPRDSKYIAEVAGSAMKNAQEVFGDTDPEKI